jgi:aspartate/methionine/tyrosine aminotransferase
MVAAFRARRSLILDGLAALPGIRVMPPPGAFYAFPEVSGTGLTGATLADRLLSEAGVCLLAGTGFGRIATSHLRVSYANSEPNLRAALERMADFLAEASSRADPGAPAPR